MKISQIGLQFIVLLHQDLYTDFRDIFEHIKAKGITDGKKKTYLLNSNYSVMFYYLNCE